MIWGALNLDTLFLRSHCCSVRRVPFNAAACLCVCSASKLQFELGLGGQIIPWLTIYELGIPGVHLNYYAILLDGLYIVPYGLQSRTSCSYS